MLTPTEAAAAIIGEIQALAIESVPLPDALDRVLAEDLLSPIDIPAWDNSAMDGYAVRAADVANHNTPAGEMVLRVIETIPAGAFPTRALGAGECARIFTGAPLPQGCDGVIRQEDTTPLPNGQVRINDARDAGRNVRYRGEDLRRGDVALTRGTALGPAQLGVLASVACRAVPVHRRPRVAIMASGDEIADLDEAQAILTGRKVASSNTYTLNALVRQSGAEPINLGIAKDDPADVRRKLESGVGADLLVTTAGVSVGEHDFLRSVLDEMGLSVTRAGIARIGVPGLPFLPRDRHPRAAAAQVSAVAERHAVPSPGASPGRSIGRVRSFSWKR